MQVTRFVPQYKQLSNHGCRPCVIFDVPAESDPFFFNLSLVIVKEGGFTTSNTSINTHKDETVFSLKQRILSARGLWRAEGVLASSSGVGHQTSAGTNTVMPAAEFISRVEVVPKSIECVVGIHLLQDHLTLAQCCVKQGDTITIVPSHLLSGSVFSTETLKAPDISAGVPDRGICGTAGEASRLARRSSNTPEAAACESITRGACNSNIGTAKVFNGTDPHVKEYSSYLRNSIYAGASRLVSREENVPSKAGVTLLPAVEVKQGLLPLNRAEEPVNIHSVPLMDPAMSRSPLGQVPRRLAATGVEAASVEDCGTAAGTIVATWDHQYASSGADDGIIQQRVNKTYSALRSLCRGMQTELDQRQRALAQANRNCFQKDTELNMLRSQLENERACRVRSERKLEDERAQLEQSERLLGSLRAEMACFKRLYMSPRAQTETSIPAQDTTSAVTQVCTPFGPASVLVAPEKVDQESEAECGFASEPQCQYWWQGDYARESSHSATTTTTSSTNSSDRDDSRVEDILQGIQENLEASIACVVKAKEAVRTAHEPNKKHHGQNKQHEYTCNINAVTHSSAVVPMEPTKHATAAQATAVNMVQTPFACAPSISSASTLCVVCMEAEKTHLFLPCSHFCTCGPCAQMCGSTCPICRATVSDIIRIYPCDNC